MTTHTANNLQFQHPEDMGKYRVVETCNFDSDYPDEKWASPVMNRVEFQKAYGELQDAIRKARRHGSRRIRLSCHSAVILDNYIFDPEDSIEEEQEEKWGL